MLRAWLLLIFATALPAQGTNQFIVASYNVENWNSIERRGKPDQPKPRAEKNAVISVISAVRPDVLAMEEMGKTNDLAEVTALLHSNGLSYAYSEWIQGPDPDRHVCVLSRFPVVERHSRTNYSYELNGRTTYIGRGILDVLIKVNDNYSFRAIVAHLKSKRPVDYGDQAAMRLEEARLLRAHVGKILKAAPEQNLVLTGDLNDTPDSEPLHAIIGVSPFQLLALRPLDSTGNDGTHYWRARREFSRIDYLILSPGMSHEYVADSARIADVPGWDKGSDHRMVYASFLSHDVSPGTTSDRRSLLWMVALIVVLLIVLGILYRRKLPLQRAP